MICHADPIISTHNLNLRIEEKQYRTFPKEVIYFLDVSKFDQTFSKTDEVDKEDNSSNFTNFYKNFYNTELSKEEQCNEDL